MRNQLITSITLLCGLLSSCGSTSSEISIPDEFDGDIIVARNIEVNRNSELDDLSVHLPTSKETLRSYQREGRTFDYESALAISKLWNEGQIKQVNFTIYYVDTTTGEHQKFKVFDQRIFCLGPSVANKKEVARQMMAIGLGSNRWLKNPHDYQDFIDNSDRFQKEMAPKWVTLSLKVCSSILK